MRKKTSMFVVLMLLIVSHIAAQRTITGTVSVDDGGTMPGATVVAIGNASVGTVTDIEGKFTLQVPASTTTLIVSFVGYQTKEISISEQSYFEITLTTASYSGASMPKGKGRAVSFSSKGYEGEQLPENMFRAQKPFSSLFKYTAIGIGVGYHRTAFLNNNFGTHMDNGELNYEFGMCANVALSITPLIFDVTYFNSKYSYTLTGGTSNDNVNYKGWEFSASSYVYRKHFEYASFNFYGGAGWHTGKATDTDVLFSNFPSDQKKIEQAFWKLGFHGSLFYMPLRFTAEYKQSFNVNAVDAFNEMQVGLQFTPGGLKSWGHAFSGGYGVGGGIGEVMFGGDAKDYMQEENLTLSYGYHQSTFLNDNFASNVDKGYITPVWGHAFNVRYHLLYPVMLDIGSFSSIYKIEKNTPGWAFADSIKVRHRGMEMALLMPVFSLFQNFIPYGGFGYQSSTLTNTSTWDVEEKIKYEVVAVNTSSAIWKAGIMINFLSTMLTIEYKHSLLNKRSPFSQLTVCYGY